MNRTQPKRYVCITLALLAAAAAPGTSFGVDYYLRADTVTRTMPDGRAIVMWGFAQDSAFGAEDGEVTVPGPTLAVSEADPNLVIHLDNNLAVAVSIVVPSLPATAQPVTFTDDRGRQRVKSFTHETPPNNGTPVVYEWRHVRPGTFLYHSGTHPAVQVQMGLYGVLVQNAGPGQAYPGIGYDREVVLCYSEIDPALHEAVAADRYGPGKAITSTVEYAPRYFLVNGTPYTQDQTPLDFGQVQQTVLLRLVNAGLETHVPVFHGLRATVVAEAGYPYRHAKDQYSIVLPALQTTDVLVKPTTAGRFAVYDRRLRLTNASASPGGMLTHLQVRP